MSSTDINGEYDKPTHHKGPGATEFEKPGFIKQTPAVDIPENGELILDVALQPVTPQPPAV